MPDTLKPQDLNAEERAIVDSMFLMLYSDYGTETEEERYALVLRKSKPIILARRALFAAPQEKLVQECNPTDHVWSWGECLTCGQSNTFKSQPATPPAPVASELPHEVRNAAAGLRKQAEEYPDCSAGRIQLRIAADRLEVWARSLPSASAGLPKVRELIFYVRQLTPHLTNLGYADLSRSFEDHAAAALAELDAAQAVPVPTWERDAVLSYAETLADIRYCGGKLELAKKMRAEIETFRRYLAAVEGGRA